jgi:hypothetical protein
MVLIQKGRAWRLFFAVFVTWVFAGFSVFLRHTFAKSSSATPNLATPKNLPIPWIYPCKPLLPRQTGEPKSVLIQNLLQKRGLR